MLESCRQQACCHLSVESLGAAPGLWLGLPSFPQWARDLDGQQAPRPRLSANSNRLLAVPRPGGLGGKSCLRYLCYTQEASDGGTRQDAPGDVPWNPPASASWWPFPPQKYNADYDLSARQGADTLAFMSLLEEKLLPVLVSVPRPASVHGQRGRGQAPRQAWHGDQKPTLSRAGALAQTCLSLPRSIRFGWTARTMWK